jgi:hypothetical protein
MCLDADEEYEKTTLLHRLYGYLLHVPRRGCGTCKDDIVSSLCVNLFVKMCLDAEKRNIYVFGGQTLFLHLSGEDRPTAGTVASSA